MNFHKLDGTNEFKTPPTGFGTLRMNHQEQGIGPNYRRATLNVIRSAADLGVHILVDQPLVIGRDDTCDLTLHDLGVSRRHAIVRAVGAEAFILQDLNSTNGTWVQGSLVTGPCELTHGQKIVLGESVLQFSLADEIDVNFQNEVSTLVRTDPLTGLPSKQQFDQALEFALHSAQLTQSSLSMLMMDMDGVKQINDTNGHLFGAYVIGEVGKLIQQTLGTKGSACRFGGDEFSAFLPGVDEAQAVSLAEKIRSRVQSAGFQMDGIELAPTISIGVASYSSSIGSLQLIARADEALYAAKASGKNRVVSARKAA